jgi:hypothetical protein
MRNAEKAELEKRLLLVSSLSVLAPNKRYKLKFMKIRGEETKHSTDHIYHANLTQIVWKHFGLFLIYTYMELYPL